MTNNYPKISIITPSYNQACFLEETIQSVLNQNYPNLEYWVIDGGSDDGSVDILKKYEKFLHWISEKDSGQTHAINKGMKKATGEIVAFLNSDDLLTSNSLFEVAKYFQLNPEAHWITGKCININENGMEIRKGIRVYKNFWLNFRSYRVLLILNYISQPSTFWRRSILDEIGYFNESLYYTMDYEYWCRIGKKYPLYFINQNLSLFRIHNKSKSGKTANKQFDEELKVAKRFGRKFEVNLHKIHRFITVTIYEKVMGLGVNSQIKVSD